MGQWLHGCLFAEVCTVSVAWLAYKQQISTDCLAPLSPHFPPCPSPPSPFPNRAKGWNTGAVLQPLGSAAIGAFKVHQFCGGFNQEAAHIYDTLHERTVHYARMMDPQWLRSTKWA